VTPVVLSHFQANELLAALRRGEHSVISSLDLNRTRTSVALTPAGAQMPSGAPLDADLLADLTADENACWLVEEDALSRIQAWSEEFGRAYSLYPTPAAPTMLVSGIPMHRIKETDPWQDTLAKVRAAGPLTGAVLDTCTGLGYTALEAARTATQVITCELDVTAHSIIRRNPWSAHLFETPTIECREGDSAELITTFADGAFDVILHDPPMFSLAGDLYSLEFYRECRRVLRRRGRLFHYIGNPESKSGATVTRGVIRRLHEAGFSRVAPRPQAFGVVASV
jgi:predicted methyltransferase